MRISLYAGATPVGNLSLPDASDSPKGTPTLAQAIWLSGLVPPPPLCSGLGPYAINYYNENALRTENGYPNRPKY